MTITTICIDYNSLPERLDCRQPDTVAAEIERTLRAQGVAADASDLCAHLKVEVPTAQLTAATTVLSEMHLI